MTDVPNPYNPFKSPLLIVLAALALCASYGWTYKTGYGHGEAAERLESIQALEDLRHETEGEIVEAETRTRQAEILAENRRLEADSLRGDIASLSDRLQRAAHQARAGAGAAKPAGGADDAGPDWIGAFAQCAGDYARLGDAVSTPLNNYRAWQDRERALIPDLSGLFPAPPLK